MLSVSKPIYSSCVPTGFDNSQRYSWTSTTLPGQADQAYISDESMCAFTAGVEISAYKKARVA